MWTNDYICGYSDMSTDVEQFIIMCGWSGEVYPTKNDRDYVW